MAAIDLSKAKIGDKFRTRCGDILVYIGEHSYDVADKYLLKNERGFTYSFYDNGNYIFTGEHLIDLVEQVFDETLDTTERDEQRNHEMQKFVEDAKEEKQELQRRQEVVELAEMIFFSDRGNMYSFKECVEVAEHSVNIRNQYLKEGKLC